MREYALDNIWETPERFKTPSRRTFFPRSVSSSRSVESQEEVKTVGDDFSTPDRFAFINSVDVICLIVEKLAQNTDTSIGQIN